MSAADYRKPVKVVIINTRYVETDVVSFKSVVQSLTGKDSTVPVPSKSSSSPRRDGRCWGQTAGVRQPAVMSRDLSFKDFDRLLKELPPLEELYRLCAD